MNILHTFLRPAQPDDCHEIYEVHTLAVRDVCCKFFNDGERDRIRQAWLALLSPHDYVDMVSHKDKSLWVIEYRNHIYGFFQLDLHMAQLDALYVHPFTQNKGLGTALLQRAENMAQKANLSMIRLYTLPHSVSFYELNQYQVLGEAIMPFSEEVSTRCYLMRKFLF